MTYQIELRPAALRALRALPAKERQRLGQKIDELKNEPRAHGVEKLMGRENRYRVRSGDYRIVYEIHDQVLLVVVLQVGHRREIYR